MRGSTRLTTPYNPGAVSPVMDKVLGNWDAGVPPADSRSIPEPGQGTVGVLGLLLGMRWLRGMRAC